MNLFETSLHADFDFDFIRFQCEIFAFPKVAADAVEKAVAGNCDAEKHLS